jgi:CBS domain-containing protein
MKIREIMSTNPTCCLATDTAQSVAQTMRDRDIGSLPVVSDPQSRELLGVITDRDLCCSLVAEGLDPKTTPIGRFIATPPLVCREGENVEACERVMQEHQVRRIPIVDAENHVIGIVAQADLALKDKPERVSKTVAEISKSARPSIDI